MTIYSWQSRTFRFRQYQGSNILPGSPLSIGYWQTDKHSVTAIYGQLVNAICQTQ